MAEPERRRRRLRPPSSVRHSADAPPLSEPQQTEPPNAEYRSDRQQAERQLGEQQPSGPASERQPSGQSAERQSGATPMPSAVSTAAWETGAGVIGPGGPQPRPRAATRRPPPGAACGPAGEEPERGLRGLVGSGSSQVTVGAAMRARDAARPTDEHLAEADQHLPIVRRNWLPREELPRTR